MLETQLRLATGADVRALVARLVLGDAHETSLGSITLKKHQASAINRIELAIEEFGGALLCDDVGMGKTYVATAIARAYSRVAVIAPACLWDMWRHALSTTGVSSQFVSFERLSRRQSSEQDDARSRVRNPLLDEDDIDLLIIDEAHHARNRATRRYRALERLARTARVLLLSATPLHNRRNELSALLSLFMGARAKNLTAAEVARVIIRRQHADLDENTHVPTVLPIKSLTVTDRPEIVELLLALPEAIPARNGGLARVLVARGLVHQWASSEAALRDAVAKRIAKATALIESLKAGVYPTEQELRTWVFQDGSLQLGFPELLATRHADSYALLQCVTHHRDALRDLPVRPTDLGAMDAERAEHLLRIRDAHPGEKIVAFAQYAATVTMLFRRIMREGRVAVLTAAGARVAGGRLTRREALERFAPHAMGATQPSPAEAIELLLTTDLLSEGVNLQDAAVVVHLDLPWTSARMQQRVGRVARIGSLVRLIQPYVFEPPASAEQVLETDTIIRRKRDLEQRHVESPAEQIETLRSLLAIWLQGADVERLPSRGCVASERRGFLALATSDRHTRLVVNLDGRTSMQIHDQIEACRCAAGPDIPAGDDDYARALEQLRYWFDNEAASVLAGAADSSNVRRKRLLNRIDRVIEHAPPHSRAKRVGLAADARRIVAAQHTGAIELELDELARSDLHSEEWLTAITRLDPHVPAAKALTKTRVTIEALLLLKPADCTSEAPSADDRAANQKP